MGGGCGEGGEQHLHLFLLGAGGEERRASINLEYEAAQRPDVDLMVVRLHEYNFRGAVVSALDVGELLLIEKAGRAEIDQLHPRLAQFLEDHILRLYIAMYDVFLCGGKTYVM